MAGIACTNRERLYELPSKLIERGVDFLQAFFALGPLASICPFVLHVNQHVLMLHGNVCLIVFTAILPYDLASEVLLAKHLIEQGLKVRPLVFIDAGDEYSVRSKKLTSQLKARVDHGTPIGVKSSV